MKNYLSHVCWLVGGVVAGLLVLHFLPTIPWGDTSLRRVDLLADIRLKTAPASALPPDTFLLPPIEKPVFVDTCKAGLTCIEDYADSTRRGMDAFYAALDRCTREQGSVRIAYFGDSFIEADIFTADLRSLLQSHYGGCGAGFVPITSPISGFRPTLRHSFNGWESHLTTDSARFDPSLQGIAHSYFRAREGATIEIKGQSRYALHLDTFEVATLYFHTTDTLLLQATINKTDNRRLTATGAPGLQVWTVDGHIGRIAWQVEQTDSALFYGVALDGRHGISLDNFSVRGSTGLSLCGIPRSTLQAFNRLRPYDLIVLQYGLNVANARQTNYDAYRKGMEETVEYLKACFPQAGILLVGIGDRDARTETGEVATMPCVTSLIRYQQAVAANTHIAFWNLFTAMGGPESMARLVHATPAMANHDYTHINFLGGKHLADLLYQTLCYGKEQYDRRHAH